MKRTILMLAALVLLSGQTPTIAPATGSNLHLVYQWGYNTPAANSGSGTGTTTVDFMAAAPDGGVTVQLTDWIWNTNRPRQTNVCELYATGTVTCSKAPYAISPIQITILPLLAKGVFSQLSPSAKSSWKQTYSIRAALLPSASENPYLSNPYTWNFDYTFTGEGPIADAKGLVLVTSTGTFTQQNQFFKGTGKQKIAYDPSAGIPIAINDVRTHVPQRSIYSNDMVDVKLLSVSAPKQ